METYYTHQQAEGAANIATAPAFLERLRTHVAWRTDRSEPLTAEGVHKLLGQQPGRICDVGCGNGGLLAGLQRLGHRVQGVEPDPAARAAAEAQGVPVVAGTAEALPDALPFGECDLVILSHVLEHCLEPQRALEQVRRLLRPGGSLICEVPNNAATGLLQSGAAWYWLDVPRHLNFFTERSLVTLCATAGFQKERISFTGYTRQFNREWRAMEDSIAAGFHQGAPSGWRLLLSTLFAQHSRKYDSVRIHARVDAASQSD